MSNKKSSTTDTEAWILLFLFKENFVSLDSMIDNGCKKMVYGQSYDAFISKLDESVDNGFIERRRGVDEYKITNRGKFEVNRMIAPLLGIGPANIELIIEKLKDQCDVQFLIELRNAQNHEGKEILIKQWALQNLDRILFFINHITTYFR